MFQPPPEIKAILQGKDELGRAFYKNPRLINSNCSFASVSSVSPPLKGTGPPVFTVQGSMAHNLGSIEPRIETRNNNQNIVQPRNMQVYFYSHGEVDLNFSNRYTKEVIMTFIGAIKQYNAIYKTIKPKLGNNNISRIKLQLKDNKEIHNAAHPRTYNKPTCDEVAGLIITNIEDSSTSVNPRYLNINVKSSAPMKISSLNSWFDPLAYMVTHTHGELGWTTNLPFRWNRIANEYEAIPEEIVNNAPTIPAPPIVAVEEEKMELQDPVQHEFNEEEQENNLNHNNNNNNNNNNKRKEKYLSPMKYYAYRGQVRDRPRDINDPNTNNDSYCDDIINDVLLYGGALCQQYWIDQWIKTEEQRLCWISTHQSNLKSQVYQGLVDAVKGDNPEQSGTYVVLPSSHTGSPRHNHQCYQDSMAVVRKFGKPDLFITFTCNPKWREITESLKTGQQPYMRPDLITRVFNMKLNELLHDLYHKQIFGKVSAMVYVVEFQKRGLPHAHILLILDTEDKIKSIEEIDDMICAELPDPTNDPTLFNIVTSNMLHGPCGRDNPNCPCMENGVCQKQFPKQFTENTLQETDSFPQYRRRNSHTYQKNPHENSFKYNNSWVVPYNPYLLKKYNAHINVELCASIVSVKYLYKYIYKGHDKTLVSVTVQEIYIIDELGNQVPITSNPNQNHHINTNENNNENQNSNNNNTTSSPSAEANSTTTTNNNDNDMNNNVDANLRIHIDEVQKYIDTRYVGSCEGFWRLFGYPLSAMYPLVVRLQVHLENQQSVLYQQGKEQEAAERATGRNTMLIAYLQKVQEEREMKEEDKLTERYLHKDKITHVVYPSALEITYQDFPHYYTWIAKERVWKRRTSPPKSSSIGRIYSAFPSGNLQQSERYYLRILLCNVVGCGSFEELKVVEGFQCETYHQSCIKRGLVQDDTEWVQCLEEASLTQFSSSLRQLFAIILIYNTSSNISGLWDKFKDALSEDYKRKRIRILQNFNINTNTNINTNNANNNNVGNDMNVENNNENNNRNNNVIEVENNINNSNVGTINVENYNDNMNDIEHNNDGNINMNNEIDSISTFTNSDYYLSLRDIDEIIWKTTSGKENISSYNLLFPELTDTDLDYLNNTIKVVVDNNHNHNNINRTLLSEHQAYNKSECQKYINETFSLLNEDQKSVIKDIQDLFANKDSIERNFFIDALGGTGKTFIFKYLINYFRSEGKIILPMASSGIASTLLPGGKTAHSMLKIPIPIFAEASCFINESSQLAELLKHTDVIIWDEAPMMEKNNLQAVDTSLKSLLNNDKAFGGIMFILGGDFRQVLPVISGVNKTAIIESTIKKSHLWNTFNIKKLTINERVRRYKQQNSNDPTLIENLENYCKFLLDMGEGKLPIENSISPSSIQIPDKYIFKGKTLEEFVDHVIPPNTYHNENKTQVFSTTSILCSTNVTVEKINDICLKKHPGQLFTLESADEIEKNGSDNSTLYPIEFLNKLAPSGMPLHELKLKVGTPVMLLRNMDARGLCNGTRLEIHSVGKLILLAKVLIGPLEGEIVTIPRINLQPSDAKQPFQFIRRQFPIKVAYAMTINKCQGQSMKNVGIYLPSSIFSHGQLYVAFSRAESPENVKVYIEDVKDKQGKFTIKKKVGIYTNNIVYQEVLAND